MRKLLGLMLIAVLCLAQKGTHSGIDRNMFDPACKPCDDFWRYATGTWVDQHPIPADRARWGTFDELSEANLERLKSILDSAAMDPKATGDRRKVGDYFASCMDTASIDAAGAKPIEPLLGQIAAIHSRQDLVAMLVSMELQDRLTPTRVTNVSDPDNADQVIAGITVGGLSLPDRDYYFQDDAKSKTIREEFVKHTQTMLRLLGDSPESAAAGAKIIVEFETALANATLTNVARRDPYNRIHKMSFAQLESLAPAYDWKAAFRLLGVPTAGTVNVSEPEFLRTFNKQLDQVPLESWKIWLRWRAVNSRAQFLSKPFYDEWFHLERTVLSGVARQQERWKVCVSSTDGTLVARL